MNGWVRINVEIDGEEHSLGRSLFTFERDEDPSEFASGVLREWDEARDKSERTLRLFGVEGVMRRLMEENHDRS